MTTPKKRFEVSIYNERIRKKHPERKGFIIDKIVEIKEYEFLKPVGQRF